MKGMQAPIGDGGPDFYNRRPGFPSFAGKAGIPFLRSGIQTLNCSFI